MGLPTGIENRSGLRTFDFQIAIHLNSFGLRVLCAAPFIPNEKTDKNA